MRRCGVSSDKNPGTPCVVRGTSTSALGSGIDRGQQVVIIHVGVHSHVPALMRTPVPLPLIPLIPPFIGSCAWTTAICTRGLELAFQRVPGVVGTSVGYTQGTVDKPTYGDVCSGSTGHTEAVQVIR